MSISERCVDNNGVQIHYLDNLNNNDLVPLVIVPGLAETAEDYARVMHSLAPRRCIAVTLRGRGTSGAPATGYTLEDHVSDIEAVVNQSGLAGFCLMGFSRGVSYAISYAVNHANNLRGLILGDYPARHTQLFDEWADWFLTTSWRGKKVSERMAPSATRALQQESRLVEFWDDLWKIACPALILRGGQEGSLLTEEDVKLYLRFLPNVRVKIFEQSSHDLQDPDYEGYIQALSDFLRQLNLTH